MTSAWTEVADRVLVRRYPFFDQDIVVVLGNGGSGGEALLVDTRSTHVQAQEIVHDLRALGSPRVGVVVNTHGHYDHAFGNRVFRPAPIWGHERCQTMLERFGEAMREGFTREAPALAEDTAAVVIDPPDHLFSDTATLDLGGREIRLAYLGRAHTDNDVVVHVPDADALCAGDLVENGATPYFGDGYPMDWPETAEALLSMMGADTVVIPGHGDHAGRAFVEDSLVAFRANAALARRVHAGELDLEAAFSLSPFPPKTAREPLERAVAQLRGELDVLGEPADQPLTTTPKP